MYSIFTQHIIKIYILYLYFAYYICIYTQSQAIDGLKETRSCGSPTWGQSLLNEPKLLENDPVLAPYLAWLWVTLHSHNDNGCCLLRFSSFRCHLRKTWLSLQDVRKWSLLTWQWKGAADRKRRRGGKAQRPSSQERWCNTDKTRNRSLRAPSKIPKVTRRKPNLRTSPLGQGWGKGPWFFFFFICSFILFSYHVQD
jgi:hypothetical protein